IHLHRCRLLSRHSKRRKADDPRHRNRDRADDRRLQESPWHAHPALFRKRSEGSFRKAKDNDRNDSARCDDRRRPVRDAGSREGSAGREEVVPTRPREDRSPSFWPRSRSQRQRRAAPIPDLTLRRLRTIRLFWMIPFLLCNKLKSKDRPRLPFQFSSVSRLALNPIFRLDAEYDLTILS